MTDGIETRESPPAQAEPARRPLTRERILHAGLRLIDEQGLEAFTMRKLAQEFGVDPMALYRHFANKDALLDSVAERLWGEVELPLGDTTWEELLRAFAISLRRLSHAHPHAYALLLTRQNLSLALLRLTDIMLTHLQRVGFAQKRAREIICTICSYAMGYAMVELSALMSEPSEYGASERTDTGRITQLMRHLPRETPAHLVEVACILADCDMDAQFLFGLDLMLTSLRASQR